MEDKWVKSSRSGETNCVEVRLTGDGGAQLRDSKDPSGPILIFTRGEWEAFVAGARDGEFDL